MTTPSLDRPVRSTLFPPAISSLPTSTRIREPDAVGTLASTTRSWVRQPQGLPTRVTVALWIVLVGAGAVAGWLVAVRAGVATCSGRVCAIATLGHPDLLLVLAAICVVNLLTLAPFTRGLTRAGGPELVAMTAAGTAGVGSLLGLVALAALAVLAGFLTLAAVVAAFEPN
jgi:hypothetical protein